MGLKQKTLLSFHKAYSLDAQFCVGKWVITAKDTCGFPSIPQDMIFSPGEGSLAETSWVQIGGQNSSLPRPVGTGEWQHLEVASHLGSQNTCPINALPS